MKPIFEHDLDAEYCLAVATAIMTPATDGLVLRMARRRPCGGVDTASAPIVAPSLPEAIQAASREVDAFLDGEPGVAVLTRMARTLWSERRGMSRPGVLALLGT